MIAVIGTLFVSDFRHKYSFGTAFCLILLISRFAYASVWQRIGIMEAWAFFFFALSALAALSFYHHGRLSQAVSSLALFFVCGYTHERYLVVAGFLTLIVLLAPHQTGKTKLLLGAIPASIVALNILVKTWVLHTQFLMGTGGHSVKFDPRTISSFMGDALANIFGFNNGLDYFAGFDVRRLGHWAWAPGISITIGFSSIGALFLLRRGRKAFRPALLFASLLLPLLVSASITVDQEFRWLYGPELALIAATFMMTAQLIEEIPGRRVAWGGLGLFLAGTTAIDVIA